MVEEVWWLEVCGVDVIIVMGNEVGGYCGMFFVKMIELQVGIFVLVLQVVDVVKVLIIVVGGIGDVCGVVVVLVLGVLVVQIGMVYMLLLEVKILVIYCVVFKQVIDVDIVFINLFIG